MAEIQEIFEEVKKKYPDFNGEIRVKLARDPFEAKGHEALWEVLVAQIQAECGIEVEPAGENAWGDAAIFQAAGIPTLMLGARGDNFHAPQEWVSISELGMLINILQKTVEQFCVLRSLST